MIPVYNAFPEAVACLRSVVQHTPSQHPILVVDDCSTAGSFREALPEDLLRDPRLRVVRNGENLGFVKTCNWAMRETAPADVVLLNSDTEVTPGWLDKLRAAAASDPRVGTVTPLTTCGTICSIPEFLKDNELPPGYSLHEFAALVESVSVREYPKLPTCVGFCVYIKREVIDRVGVFDEAAFGKGYGEENDFSCRLQAAGYTDILDDATFVYHRGGMSFLTETNELIAEHLKILDRKHPHYLPAVNQFVASNPLAAVHGRIYNAMLRRWDQRAEYTVLHVLHNRPLTRKSAGFPGGVEYHVADLIRTIPEAAHWSLYAAGGEYILTAHVPGCEREYRAPVGTMNLSALICREHFDIVHLHHASAFDFRLLADAVLRHGQYLVSAHDFRMLCPTVNMVMPDGRLCAGHECPDVCHFSRSYIEQLRSTAQRSSSERPGRAALLPVDQAGVRQDPGRLLSLETHRARHSTALRRSRQRWPTERFRQAFAARAAEGCFRGRAGNSQGGRADPADRQACQAPLGDARRVAPHRTVRRRAGSGRAPAWPVRTGRIARHPRGRIAAPGGNPLHLARDVLLHVR